MVEWSALGTNEQDFLDGSWNDLRYWRVIQYEPEAGDDETNSYNQHLCITGDEGAIDHEIKTKDEWDWYSKEKHMDWDQVKIQELIGVPAPLLRHYGGRIKSTRKRKTTRRKNTRRKTTRRKTTRRKTSKHKVTMRNSKRKNTRRRN